MNETTPEVYPQYCFHLSPTISKWVPLHTKDVFGLGTVPGFEGQDVYFFGNHPVKWVRVCGLVVAVDDYGERRIYTVDDSSGRTIECVTMVKRAGAGIGGPSEAVAGTASGRGDKDRNDRPSTRTTTTTTVQNQGRKPALTITTTPSPSNLRPREEVGVGHILDIKGTVRVYWERQIAVDRMSIVRGPDEEVSLWEKRNRFWEEVLRKPWVLDDKVVRRCRKEAEREGDGSREKEKEKENEREKEKRRRLRELKGRADLGQDVQGEGWKEAEGGDEGEVDGRKERKKKRIVANLGPAVGSIAMAAKDEDAAANMGKKKRLMADLGAAARVSTSTHGDYENTEARTDKERRRKYPTDLGAPRKQSRGRQDVRRNNGQHGPEVKRNIESDPSRAVSTDEPTDAQGLRKKKECRSRLVADLGTNHHPQSSNLKSSEHSQAVSDIGREEGDSDQAHQERKKRRPVANLGQARVPPDGYVRQERTDRSGCDGRKKRWDMADLGTPAPIQTSRTDHPNTKHRHECTENLVSVSPDKEDLITIGREIVCPDPVTHHSPGGVEERRRNRGKADLGGGYTGCQSTGHEQDQRPSRRPIADLGQERPRKATAGIDGEAGELRRPACQPRRRWVADMGYEKIMSEPSINTDKTGWRGTALADLGQSRSTERKSESSDAAVATRRAKRGRADLG